MMCFIVTIPHSPSGISFLGLVPIPGHPLKCFPLSAGDWRDSQALQMSKITILRRFAAVLNFLGWSIIGFIVLTTILLLAGEGGGKDAIALPFAFTALIVIGAVTGIIPIVIGWIIRYFAAEDK